MGDRFFFDDYEIYQMMRELDRRMIRVRVRQLHLTPQQKANVNAIAAVAATGVALREMAQAAEAMVPALMAMQMAVHRAAEEARREILESFKNSLDDFVEVKLADVDSYILLMADETMTADELRQQDFVERIWDRVYYTRDNGRIVSEAVWFFMVRLSWLIYHLPVWLWKDRKLARARGWMNGRLRGWLHRRGWIYSPSLGQMEAVERGLEYWDRVTIEEVYPEEIEELNVFFDEWEDE